MQVGGLPWHPILWPSQLSVVLLGFQGAWELPTPQQLHPGERRRGLSPPQAEQEAAPLATPSCHACQITAAKALRAQLFLPDVPRPAHCRRLSSRGSIPHALPPIETTPRQQEHPCTPSPASSVGSRPPCAQAMPPPSPKFQCLPVSSQGPGSLTHGLPRLWTGQQGPLPSRADCWAHPLCWLLTPPLGHRHPRVPSFPGSATTSLLRAPRAAPVRLFVPPGGHARGTERTCAPGTCPVPWEAGGAITTAASVITHVS